ncbi:MAG: 1-deoxy-D-xylulose-5-phosphate synthase [Verrucomicrobiota bacterium]|nr:1-deoxy-D-xylulose-5-phosphate synthase [Verrucomicrobiota bacterium]
MSLLETIKGPEDVKALPAERLPELAEDLRSVILDTVSKTGGHLASNLGTVELAVALLRVFAPPADKVVWDVGHQTYAWKLLTGRRERFDTLRQHGGLSGFPKPQESACDAFVGGHAGTALSAALGMAVARDRLGAGGHVVAVVGDGSLTNGITLEALNSIDDTASKVIVVLNDNEMSISENVGALSRRLGRMLTDVRYNRIKAAAEKAGHRLHMTPLRRVYHRLEQAVKSLWLHNAFFEEFGIRYIGPIDGHDFHALENAFCTVRDDKRSVLIHIATQKGRGFRPAERSPRDWHGVGAFELEARHPPEGAPGYSQVFGETLAALADGNPKVMAITAAMRGGTGLEPFAVRHPARFFDVGICESHAVVFAAGLAASGFRPVFAVYSTFLQRAVDSVMHDVCLQNLPVLFCLDRAGVVGSDGPTHHGIFDIPMLRCLPNLTLMQPKDECELAVMMRAALAHDGPVAIRYPRGAVRDVGETEAADVLAWGRAEVLQPAGGGAPVVWFWALGDMLPLAAATAARLAAAGVRAGVVNARFIKPLDTGLLAEQARGAACFVTLENGAAAGGFGSAVREALAACGFGGPVRVYGWPDEFVGQGTTAQLMADHGLTPERIAEEVARDVLMNHECTRIDTNI